MLTITTGVPRSWTCPCSPQAPCSPLRRPTAQWWAYARTCPMNHSLASTGEGLHVSGDRTGFRRDGSLAHAGSGRDRCAEGASRLDSACAGVPRYRVGLPRWHRGRAGHVGSALDVEGNDHHNGAVPAFRHRTRPVWAPGGHRLSTVVVGRSVRGWARRAAPASPRSTRPVHRQPVPAVQAAHASYRCRATSVAGRPSRGQHRHVAVGSVRGRGAVIAGTDGLTGGRVLVDHLGGRARAYCSTMPSTSSVQGVGCHAADAAEALMPARDVHPAPDAPTSRPHGPGNDSAAPP
jgi:hypothetical protein